jgi:two-component system heavy metal sensor histidine kinase CusS
LKPRRLASSLAARITVASTLVGLAVAAAAGAFGYWAVVQHLDERVELELRGRREQVVHVLTEMQSPQAVASVRHRFDDILIGHEGLHLALVEPASGAVLAVFSSTARNSLSVLKDTADSDEVRNWHHHHERLAALRGLAPVANGENVRYFLSTSRTLDDELIGHYLNAIVIGLPALLVVVALGAWGVAKTGLAPLHRFNRLAASIGARSLHRRLAVEDLPAELAELGHEFNGMLDRIDSAYTRLQEFSGDLAHEMRTPVATLLGRSQVALSQGRSIAELREVLEGNVDEMERLSRLISDILFMARAEEGASPVKTEPVSLDAEARRVADYLSLLAEEKNVSIAVEGAAEVEADRLLVERAITNILSNAVRHASAGTRITVSVRDAPQPSLAVSNMGEGIAPQHHQRLFDRFYRVDPGRARNDGGTGLGLAIVRTIMFAHRGTVEVASELGGITTFTLTFPRSRSGSMATG